MTDILLDREGDIVISAVGDISLTDSIRQAVLIRLRWIYDEWRLGPQYGFPWFEEVFIKNPNIAKLKGIIAEEIMQVEGVTSAAVDSVVYSRGARTATFRYTVSVGGTTFREEVELYGRLRADPEGA